MLYVEERREEPRLRIISHALWPTTLNLLKPRLMPCSHN